MRQGLDWTRPAKEELIERGWNWMEIPEEIIHRINGLGHELKKKKKKRKERKKNAADC